MWNKIDLIPEERRPHPTDSTTTPKIVTVSALSGEGLEALQSAIERHVSSAQSVFHVELSGEGLAQIHRLYELGEVLNRTDAADGSTKVRIRISEEGLSRFHQAFPNAYILQ